MTLTKLETLYLTGVIDRKLFIEYYQYNDNDDLVLRNLRTIEKVADQEIPKLANINNLIFNRIIEGSLKARMSMLHNFFILDITENNLIVGVKESEDKRRIEEFLLEKNYNSVKFLDFSLQEFESLYRLYLNRRRIKVEDQLDSIPKLIEELLLRAVDYEASDIHIEPYGDYIRIRYRINGLLEEYRRLNIKYLDEISSKFKLLSKLNIAEKRDIHDGEFTYKLDGKRMNFRINIFPTLYGEKLSIRVLGSSNDILDIHCLEFGDSLANFKDLIEENNGLIIISGPTGCGKTTTLYSILDYLNTEEKQIVTVEDPVEYKIDGINQIQVNEKIGFDFDKGLKAILRADPEILMIGEIRNKSTAVNATRASITGHLVFTTLHTNTSLEAINRLLDIGVEPFMIASSLKGIVSQRLVKILCPICKEKYELKNYEKDILGQKIQYGYRRKACSSCRKGFVGRKAIFEIVRLKEKARLKIRDNQKINLEDLLLGKSLEENCIDLINKGEIEFQEIYNIGGIAYSKPRESYQ